MKRTIFLLLVLSGMVVPCQAVKRVTVPSWNRWWPVFRASRIATSLTRSATWS